MTSITGTKAKALALTMMIPAILIASGCKSTTTHTGPGWSISANDPSIGTSTTDLQPDVVDSPADAAPVDDMCPTSNTVAFAKTKFVLHTGAGFGAFHQWIWKPYKVGTFKKGSNGRVMAFVKAGAAALFVKREIRLATQDVKASPALCKLLAKPLAHIGDKVQAAYTKLRGGDTSGVTDLENSIDSIEAQAKGAGTAITEPANTDPNSVPN
ncbi:hypothetical protein [Nocardia tengchongensis]|uniref:hypothetical protein n=1 Tax=Nocardia tengchongensis TaxID=2055889 RepID=UPI00368661F4